MEKPVRDLCSCSLRDDDDSSWQKQSHVSVVRSANFAGGLDVSDEGKKNQRHSWVFVIIIVAFHLPRDSKHELGGALEIVSFNSLIVEMRTLQPF